MRSPDQPSTKRSRTLWRVLTIGFAISLVGGLILFTPALEFFVVDIIEKLKLPIGFIGNVALIGDFALFVVCGTGLIVMSIRSLLSRRR